MDINSWNVHMNKISKDIINYLSQLNVEDKDCIVFDIDETLIDLNGNVIQPIVDIYNYAKKIKYLIVLITGRTGLQKVVEYTTSQLKNKNITGYKYLYLRPNINEDPFIYKENARKSLVYNEGYTIIMSIGDQILDMGKYGGKGILLPKLKY